MIRSAITLLFAAGAAAVLASAGDPLLFPNDAFTVETKTVKTFQSQ
jgi:hypothetical protein